MKLNEFRQYWHYGELQNTGDFDWRLVQRVKTVSGGLILCLNLGIDPPDLIRPQPSAHVECWIDPTVPSLNRGMENIGKNLLGQYEFWQPKAKFRLGLDVHLEDLKKICASLRKSSREERVFFHYNGHGVPKPTKNGELWVFNKQYTQYVPCAIMELHATLSGANPSSAVPRDTSPAFSSLSNSCGFPVLYVFDCSNAGHLVTALSQLLAAKLDEVSASIRSHDLEAVDTAVDSPGSLPSVQKLFTTSPALTDASGGHLRVPHSPSPIKSATSPEKTAPSSSTMTSSGELLAALAAPLNALPDILVLAATGADECLSLHPDMPADIFTSCLTTPIEMAIRFYLLFQCPPLSVSVTLDDALKMPGRLNDRKSPLGELHWILTAVTDTIAWDALKSEGWGGPPTFKGSAIGSSEKLFQKLFRQDILVAALFRNFLLAQRIMKAIGGISCAEDPDVAYKSNKLCPISLPKLPDDLDTHPLWESWDLALEFSLSQIFVTSKTGKDFLPNPFFIDQLKSFEIYLLQYRHALQLVIINSAYHDDDGLVIPKPPNLPIILQVLLSPSFRQVALVLLLFYFDFGPWAIQSCLTVGIFAYLLKLLASPSSELFPILTLMWTKLLVDDSSLRMDLLKDDSFLYFSKRIIMAVSERVGVPSGPPPGMPSASPQLSKIHAPLQEPFLVPDFELPHMPSFLKLLSSSLLPCSLFSLFITVWNHPIGASLLRSKQPELFANLLTLINHTLSLASGKSIKCHDEVKSESTFDSNDDWTLFWALMLLSQLVIMDHLPDLCGFLSKIQASFNNASSNVTCAWLLFFNRLIMLAGQSPSSDTDVTSILMPVLLDWIYRHHITLLHDEEPMSPQRHRPKKSESTLKKILNSATGSTTKTPGVPDPSEDPEFLDESEKSQVEFWIFCIQSFLASDDSSTQRSNNNIGDLVWKTLLLLDRFPLAADLVNLILDLEGRHGHMKVPSAPLIAEAEQAFLLNKKFEFNKAFSTLTLFPPKKNKNFACASALASHRSSLQSVKVVHPKI